MTEIDSFLEKEYQVSGSESDSSVGVKNFGQDDSELSEDELNRSSDEENANDDEEDKLLETIQLKLAKRKQENTPSSGVLFVDEFKSDINDEEKSDIDDANMNDNKLKILRDQRFVKRNGKYYNKLPRFTFSSAKMKELIATSPDNIKNVAVIGPFRSGKTALVSNMIIKNHRKHFQRQKYDYLNLKKYMDNSLITKYRHSTTRLNMGSFLYDNSVVMNIIDTPGHSDFWNETQLGLEMADFVYIVIDSVEGVTDAVERLYEIASFRLGLRVAFIINKLDRLVLELKLDEVSFYLKLQDIVKDLNMVDVNQHYSPEKGNVLFASSKYHLMFSIKQFIATTNEQYSQNDEILNYITERSWGNVTFENNKFEYCANWRASHKTPSFVAFIANPLYQIFKNSLILTTQELKKWTELNFGCILKSSSEHEEYTSQMIKVFEAIFENKKSDSKVSMTNNCFVENTRHSSKLPTESDQRYSSEDSNTSASKDLRKVVRVFKAIDYNHKLWSLCKIHTGMVSIGDTLYTENGNPITVVELGVMGGRYVRTLEKAFENQIVLLRGSEFTSASGLISSGALTSKKANETSVNVVFPEFDFVNEPLMKVVLQTKKSKHLGLLSKGLKLISKLYPDVKISLDNAGEYTLYGSGELQLDTILFELRYFYICYFDRDITDFIEVKTSGNVITSFKEGCSGESFASIPVQSKNYSLSIIATNMNDNLSETICQRQFSPEKLFKEGKLIDLSSILRRDFNWESEASRNIIAVSGTNFLINDILPEDLDEQLFEDLKAHLIKGFERVVSEGPLAEEPLHNVIFKLMTLEKLEENPATPLETLPLTIKACKIALLTAKPILFEAYYSFSIITQSNYRRNLRSALKRRRGCEIFTINEIPGSTLLSCTGIAPSIDSNGLSIDLQIVTQGSSICQIHSLHRRWYKVPGDVLDEDADIPKLEPSEGDALSRDFLMKTRKRKGLESRGENALNDNGPTLRDYLDNELFLQLKELKMI